MIDTKEVNPYLLILIGLLSGGVGNAGFELIHPSRPDPYTGAEGKAEAQERREADAKLRAQIASISERCRNHRENINFLNHNLEEHLERGHTQ